MKNSITIEVCLGCGARPLCEERLERLQGIEDRAARIGALVAEGSVVCDKGPRRFVREGIPVEVCRANPILPQVTDVGLAEETANVWPGAHLQQVG